MTNDAPAVKRPRLRFLRFACALALGTATAAPLALSGCGGDDEGDDVVIDGSVSADARATDGGVTTDAGEPDAFGPVIGPLPPPELPA